MSALNTSSKYKYLRVDLDLIFLGFGCHKVKTKCWWERKGRLTTFGYNHDLVEQNKFYILQCAKAEDKNDL